VDEEDDSLLASSEQELFLNHLLKLINESAFDVIIFEDYDKGVISENLIKEVVHLANEKNIITAVDPKKRNFQFYKGVYLFKPNLKEIREGLAAEVNPKSTESLLNIDSELRKLLQHTWSLITLSEYGMFASNGTEHFQIASRPVTISDVSGAGDTVISTAALCLASGANIQLSTFLANLAGGSVCEKPGVVPVDAASLFTDAIAELKKLPD
jgi:rfaE bifunctional protein kinase chain/domain